MKKDNDPNSSYRKSVSGILKKSITSNKTNKSNAQASFSNKNDSFSMNDSKTKIQLEFQNNDSSEISSQSMNNVNETEMSTSAETNNNIMLPSTSREGNKLNLFLNKLNKKPMDQSSSDDEQSSLSQIFSTSGNDHPIIDPQSSTSGINGSSVQLSSSTDSEDFDFITDFNNIAVSSMSPLCSIFIHFLTFKSFIYFLSRYFFK